MRKAILLFHTFRYSKPRQLFLKPLSLVKQAALPTRLPAPPADLRGTLQPRVAFLHHDPWNRREQLRQGKFCFLNRAENLGQPVCWQASDTPLLWQFNLHYFHYLYLLKRDEQTDICLDWLRQNPPGKGAAWQPYPTSLRIVNWCKANFDSFDSKELRESLYRQAAYLYRHLELHHPGNHLLENARALLFAGRFFAGQGEADRWFEKGMEIYRRETPVQVLGDGGYFERSTMYHALVLQGFLDILNILPEERAEKEIFIAVAKRMGDFLVSLTHPDGEIALFNDSTQEIAASTLSLARYASQLLGRPLAKRDSFAETGYFVHEGSGIHLFIDGGPLSPDFLPSHAHGDIFSYELSIGGRQFIVDAGVFEYEAGPMRQYARSTRAHNTIGVDGKDQAEFWGSFRVGRRYHPHGVTFEKRGSSSRFQGSFDGYASLIGDRIRHRRTIVCEDEKGEISVQDEVEGRGRHRVESCIHLHPEVQLTLAEGRAILQRQEARCVIEAGAGQRLKVEDSWYCPQFGQRRKNKMLVLESTLDLPIQLTYKITVHSQL